MKFEYPSKETHKSGGFGYASDMAHLAVNRDDAEGFIRFMRECGGFECEVLLSGCVFGYAASHGATKCLEALYAAGAKSDRDLAYWLKVADKPRYGPRAAIQDKLAA